MSAVPMTATAPKRGRTPLKAVVEHAAPLPDVLPAASWRPFMSVTEVARLTGISHTTLLKWLETERCEDGGANGCTLRARVTVRVSGQVWIKTEAFRKWMAGELLCPCQLAGARLVALGAESEGASGRPDSTRTLRRFSEPA